MFEEKDKGKKWSIFVFTGILGCLLAFGAIIIWIDPFFHYHAPIEGISYSLIRENERYQNTGILTHFSYDTIITGTSLTENFRTSECEKLFGGTAVKVPLAGGTYKEMNEQLKKAFSSKNEIRTVIRCLDMQCLITDKDAMMENYDFPTYMTNDNLLDDVSYVLNKAVMKQAVKNIAYTIRGYKSTSFDEYANWMHDFCNGRDYVLMSYKLGEPADRERELTQEEITMIKENVRQNVIELIKEHPETIFYLYIPPYSICYWDEIVNKGELMYWLTAEKIAVEELLNYSNIKLYSFANDFEVICTLGNYSDQVHYADWINTKILKNMADETYMLTEDNYNGYFEKMETFLKAYDYTTLR